MNYLIIESLQKLEYQYGSELAVECPSGSGTKLDLAAVAAEITKRLERIFARDPQTGMRPSLGASPALQRHPRYGDRFLFHEYFHGDNGSGRGASHQTGWTALIAKLLQQSGEHGQ